MSPARSRPRCAAAPRPRPAAPPRRDAPRRRDGGPGSRPGARPGGQLGLGGPQGVGALGFPFQAAPGPAQHDVSAGLADGLDGGLAVGGPRLVAAVADAVVLGDAGRRPRGGGTGGDGAAAAARTTADPGLGPPAGALLTRGRGQVVAQIAGSRVPGEGVIGKISAGPLPGPGPRHEVEARVGGRPAGVLGNAHFWPPGSGGQDAAAG